MEVTNRVDSEGAGNVTLIRYPLTGTVLPRSTDRCICPFDTARRMLEFESILVYAWCFDMPGKNEPLLKIPKRVWLEIGLINRPSPVIRVSGPLTTT